MTTLVEADTIPHDASVMDDEGPPPPLPPSPSPLPSEPLTSAPAPLLHNSDAHLPSSSQQPALSQSESSTDTTTRPKSLNISTSDVSSSNNNNLPPTFNHDDSTTSPSSAISSQAESQATGSTDVIDRKPLNIVDTLKTEASIDQRSLSTSQSPEPTTLSGSKRTATGELKRSSVHGVGDVIANSKTNGHARSASTISNGSYSNGNVLEVSQQLRTKLKYAMIKVQNGWQSRTFDEVESLASQSPRSTVSGFQPFNDSKSLLSPRTVMTRKYQRESSESDSSDSTVALESRGLVNMMASPQAPSRRALAPPLDILPGSRRRPTPNAPYHGTHGPQIQTRHLHSSRPTTSQRTPSQNAAMEADAVETLLFMASPNNSGYNPPTRGSQESSSSNRANQIFASQTSPLRTQFSQTSMTSPKKVAFSEHDLSTAAAEKAALIDRMLDDLSDDSDESLERAFRLADKSKAAAAAPPVST